MIDSLYNHDESFSDDDDAQLFDELQQTKKVAEIRESLDDLLDKGKKKGLKYEELMARREAKAQK